jgi:hypothetical protein
MSLHFINLLLLLFSSPCNLYRGPSIYPSYQVSVHLAKRFQRRRFLKIGQSESFCYTYVGELKMAAPSEEKLICDQFNLEALTVNQLKVSKLWQTRRFTRSTCYRRNVNKDGTGMLSYDNDVPLPV